MPSMPMSDAEFESFRARMVEPSVGDTVPVFAATCSECGWDEEWSREYAAQCAGVWHVHDIHPKKGWLSWVSVHHKTLGPETIGFRVVWEEDK